VTTLKVISTIFHLFQSSLSQVADLVRPEFQDFRKTPESWAEAHREQVQFWRDLDAEKDVRILTSVADVLRHISENEHDTDGIVLVIGSGYLAGMARHLLKPTGESNLDDLHNGQE
jgi:broad specificity phosphatase PhoE